MISVVQAIRTFCSPFYSLQRHLGLLTITSKAGDIAAGIFSTLSVIIVFVSMWPFGGIRRFLLACGISALCLCLSCLLSEVVLFFLLFAFRLLLVPCSHLYVWCGKYLSKHGVHLNGKPNSSDSVQSSSSIVEGDAAEVGLRYFIEQDKNRSSCCASFYESDVKEPWYRRAADACRNFADKA